MTSKLGLVLCLSFVAHAVPTSDLINVNSEFFSTADVEYSATLNYRASDGDLWASAWADDDNLYSANGDGRGFSTNQQDFADIVMNVIRGDPSTGITGSRLSAGAAMGPVWTKGSYNRKPTGMLAVDGDDDGKDELYCAIQDLNNGGNGAAFNDVPAASISVSRDYGRTWTATKAPMFSNYTFTTVWWLDFGQSNRNSAVLGVEDANFAYAYGLDNNWRDSVNGRVKDPQDLWLARAPIRSIQDISTWQWFSGSSDAPAWSASISNRKAVLRDTRRVYYGAQTPDGYSVISQGSVLYNKPLNRYIYSSWTDYTFNFYEAPQPWGPWRLFHVKDFGVTPWFGRNTATPKNGGYATTTPSKFVSQDGLSMWVQSNWFVGGAQGTETNYCFSLRPFKVAKYLPTTSPTNAPSGTNNLATAPGTVPVYKGCHYGKSAYLNDAKTVSEDSWDGSIKKRDTWGYTWPQTYTMNTVIYTTGSRFSDGGWFSGNLTVEYRQNSSWVSAGPVNINPPYPYSNAATPTQRYVFTFPRVVGNGVRILGTPGGSFSFTSISELEVYYI